MNVILIVILAFVAFLLYGQFKNEKGERPLAYFHLQVRLHIAEILINLNF